MTTKSCPLQHWLLRNHTAKYPGQVTKANLSPSLRWIAVQGVNLSPLWDSLPHTQADSPSLGDHASRISLKGTPFRIVVGHFRTEQRLVHYAVTKIAPLP